MNSLSKRRNFKKVSKSEKKIVNKKAATSVMEIDDHIEIMNENDSLLPTVTPILRRRASFRKLDSGKFGKSNSSSKRIKRKVSQVVLAVDRFFQKKIKKQENFSYGKL